MISCDMLLCTANFAKEASYVICRMKLFPPKVELKVALVLTSTKCFFVLHYLLYYMLKIEPAMVQNSVKSRDYCSFVSCNMLLLTILNQLNGKKILK